MRTFVQVVDRGSFSAAAESLDIARSAVSQRVTELERRLGVRLLNRTTRNLSLTDSGQVFYENSRRILEDIDDIEVALSERQSRLVGSLRITAPMSFGQLHLVPAINDFLAEHPELEFDLNLNDRHVNIVDEGFDLAVRIGALEDSTLIARRMAPIRRLTVASPAYLERHGTPEVPGDLEQHKGLIYTYAVKSSFWKFWTGDGASVTVNVPTCLRANNGDALRDAAIAGHGVTVLPTFIIHGAVARGELVPILRDFRNRRLDLYAVYPPPRHQPQRVRSFVDFLARRFGDEPYWDRGLNGGSGDSQPPGFGGAP